MKILRNGIILLFFLSLSTPCLAFLHTKGTQIVDSSGNEILLKGIALGGWLVPEGYMLHIPGFGSPSSIRQKILNLIGSEATDEFFARYRANFIQKIDIEKIASWGVNSIRLPFNYRLISPEDQPGVFLESGFQVLDQVLEWCKENHLYLILDMHCAPGGQNAQNISDSDGQEARLWTESANQDRTVKIWTEIARRYANEEWIGGYDLLNEPVLPSGVSNTQLRAFYLRLSRAIRQVDPNHLLFIEGNWYATDFRDLTPPFDTNMAYSFHKYWNPVTQESIASYLKIRNNYRVPLWLGESGENSNPWFHECVSLMEKNNIGWCWWTYKKIATITSPYSAPLTSGYRYILNYWKGQVPRPSQEMAKQALFDMADNLALEKCRFRPDVIDALFRKDFAERSLPFQQQTIPGTLACVNYDMGDENVAYFDTGYENVKGLGSGEWGNLGGAYRNDGVDISPSNDSQAFPYNVGWIDNGEWLRFTVQIASAGTYAVRLRVASPDGGGALQILLDGSALGDAVSVSATGGWKSWKWQDSPAVRLPGGEHSLVLKFLRSGFNINAVQFIPKSNGVEESSFEQVKPSVFLGQNYPNPFNRKTEIPIVLYRPERLSVQIYNLTGQLVKTLYKGVHPVAFDRLVWDGTDSRNVPVPSGRYFYRMQVDGTWRVKGMILLRR
ncbi:MAG: cellulase family glycosylhydrolase [Calditrichaeota bacterium]|nr:cellulase family glycosylhydrolase [Calditrichota bacterium]